MSDFETTRKAQKGGSTPKPELPKFETGIELAETFRGFAEKGVQQAKENYTRLRTAAEEATDLFEDTYATATKGATEFNLKALEAVRTNVNAAFDYARELVATKSMAEAVELSASHVRKQFDAVTAQAKELSALAQKVATETAEPIKTGVSKSLRVQ